jgi:hypothetical protein
MQTVEAKKQRIVQVRQLLEKFSAEHLSGQFSQYVFNLWEQVGRKRNYIITGGAAEVWAAAVVYVIGGLNFLFDRSNPHYLPPDVICQYFGTKKGTVNTRAKEIEKVCRIRMGQEGLCSAEISDSLTFVQLPNGLVLTKKVAREMGLL